ncbi:MULTISPECIES: ATP-dependent DNA helicase [Actinotignum]|uniref:ATP-dependent DNA helicase n=1 Tax=Actinotignum TaxID=1653174 RepID=UPI00254EF21D|nr:MULTISPECIES: ATP-dependent DNA helicase [Actinotignum]MDE1535700.1 ATP-dependent DNA helicase [Actinotignum schaalii]MDK7271405.1 ATP-dependent DNA helicase [Actinotignum schaalii]MDY5143610.1 ATP-dependent DNA helicase [Actinotignum timonense]
MRKELTEILELVVADLGGAVREGQNRMVEETATALEDSSHLLIQAGTGTGKSIGYLVPLMEWSVRTGQRAAVSTATLALQRQIVGQDAPRVARAVSAVTGHEPHIALLKGWNNYVCLRKVHGGYPEDDALVSRAEGEYGASATGEEVMRLREWASETETGDRDDLVPGVSERAWRQVSLSKPECVGVKCPLREVCFPVRARTEAAEADIVITNHAMLGVHSSGTPVLPDVDAFVVDEAHDLADRVTSQLTFALSHGEITGLARLLRREKILADGIERARNGVVDILDELEEGRLTSLPAPLQDALMLLLRELQLVENDVAALPGSTESDAATKAVVRHRLSTCVDMVSAMVSDEVANGSLVVWVSRDLEGRSSLCAAPLDVSAPLADTLFEARPAILTSATLAIGGRFDLAARQIGFSYPSQGPWRGIDVGSPFTYHQQGILYIARHLPVPGKDGYGEETLRELVELVEASRGGALCLFTSRKAANEAAAYAREHLELPIFVQGEDQLPTLVKDFAADPHASLFGTLSLWQGVDVPGLTCRLVTIDRIPFPRPNDALVQARSRRANERGFNGFMDVSAAHAALLLAQGAGRLIRSEGDRGVVAILDPRLVTARYGGFLRASLPRMWGTVDGTVVRAALGRLAEQLG